MDVIFPEGHIRSMESEPKTTLQKAVHARMDELGLNAYQAAKKAGLGDSFVRDILRGKTRSPSANNLAKLAAALDTTPAKLLGRDDTTSQVRQVSAPIEGVPILGRVAANTWYTVDDADFEMHIDDDDIERIPSVSGYPVDWQFGMIVDGNCLNKVAHHGDRLVCLDLIKSQLDVEEGDLVIVERTRFEGMMVQRTAKRVKRTTLGFELWPESDDPAHQDPIRLYEVPEGESIRVSAKVLWVLRKP